MMTNFDIKYWHVSSTNASVLWKNKKYFEKGHFGFHLYTQYYGKTWTLYS